MRAALVSLLSLCALAACSPSESLEALRVTTPVGDPYAAALASGYRALAEEKLAAESWEDSAHFADKGLTAAYGGEVLPDEASARPEISDARRTEFDHASALLVQALENTRETQPALSAEALIAYDRWLAEDTDDQRAAFFAALDGLQVAQAAEPGSNPPSTAPRTSSSTVLYFPFDSDVLGDTASAAVGELVATIRAAKEPTVSINGHTDRAGSEPYNQDLSQRRAVHVLRALIAAGVPEPRMNFYAFGETDPAVPTEDGVREPKNRRVEIVVE